MRAAGRLGPAPEWPLAVPEPTEQELLKWREMWTMPQALVWEHDRTHDMVAAYVRTYLETMEPRASAVKLTFVKQLSSELLLTPGALASARYVIDGTPESAAIDAAAGRHPAGSGRAPGGAATTSARGRFTVVPTGPSGSVESDDADDEATEDATPDADDGDNEPPF